MLSPQVETIDTLEKETRGRGTLEFSCNSEAAPVLSSTAGALFHGWNGYIHESLWYYYYMDYESPAFISSSVLKTAGHMEHFPQRAFAQKSVKETCVARLSPALCLHTYPIFARERLDDEGSAVMVSGPCARYEGGKWDPSSRLYMTEMVAVGTPGYVNATREAIAGEIARTFAEVGIKGGFRDTEVPSCLGASRKPRPVKKLAGLNREFLAPFGIGSVALASVSDHRDYFGRRFGIKDVDGRPAHSFCVAFHLERLTALGLQTWGTSMTEWPELLQSHISSTAAHDIPGLVLRLPTAT